MRLRKGRGHEKWAVKRGRVMQIYARDHTEFHPQKKKEVLYLVKIKEKKKNNGTLWIKTVKYYCKNLTKIYVLFIYNNAIKSYCIFFYE